MPTAAAITLRCSACQSGLPEGTQSCRGCALPLTAFAVVQPAPIRKKTRISMLAVVVCGVALFWIVAASLDADANAKREAAVARFTADLAAGTLNTPEAFEARCGTAEKILHDTSGYTSGRTKGDTVLSHAGAKPGLRMVHVDIDQRGHVSTWESPVDESIVYDRLQCKAR